jgi:hypothetical protein
MYRALLVFALLAAGCAVRAPQTYRFAGRILIPPGVASATAPQRPIRTAVAMKTRTCSEAGIMVTRRSISTTRDALLKLPAGGLATLTAGFEEHGCVAEGEGARVATRIVESVPLEPSAAYRLLHPGVRESWYFDLGPENRLQVDSPIVRAGVDAEKPLLESAGTTRMSREGQLEVETKVSADLVGFETAWYGFRSKPQSRGLAVVPLYAESHIQGAVERTPEPRTNYFHFRADAACYRIFHRGDQTIIVVSAPTRAELDRETRALQQDPVACAAFAPQTCVLAPHNVGINATVVVTVNGKETAVPVGAPVRAAIQAGGERNPDTVLARLTVRRPYDGKLVPVEFDRANREILSMILFGGESLDWNAATK